MKKSLFSKKVLFFLIAFALVFTGAQAQVHVAADSDVGVGTTSPVGKLHVNKTSNASNYTLYMVDSDASSSSKYGVYNYVTAAGTGFRYGMRNLVYSNTANTNSTYGFSNSVRASKGYLMGNYNYAYSPTGNTSTNYGKYNYLNSSTSGTGYGMYNYQYTPSAGSGTRYGIYNNVTNAGAGVTYALYSSVGGNGAGTKWAGYFNGNVHVNGNLTWTSDERKKENISAMNGALALIDQLEPKTYTFKADADMNLPEGQQYGFLAQELEKTLPGLVKTIEQPAEQNVGAIEPLSEEAAAKGEMGGDLEIAEGESQTLKSVNYVALIPILVQAVKEQQKEIEALRKELRNK